MNSVFADTWYYAAILNRRDAGHARATAWSHVAHQTIITTEYVLVELGNRMLATNDRHLFTITVPLLKADPQHEIIPASPRLFDAGFTLFSRRLDKEWSLTDCISFIVMQQQDLLDALTADKHFEQAGFNAIFRDSQ